MEVPAQFLAVLLTASVALQAWQVRMLYRLSARIRDVETTLEFNGLKLPALRE